jgi:hypothetical protein
MAQTNGIMNQMLDIVGSYSCMAEFSEMQGFFSNQSNLNAVNTAQQILGIPPKNREAHHTFFGGWTDYCDWDKGILKFYSAARLLSDYPPPAETQQNCGIFKNYANSIEASKTVADKGYTINVDAGRLQVIQSAIADVQSYYRGKYASMNCDTYLSDLEKQKVADAMQSAKQFDFNLVSQTSTAANTTSNVVSYVLIGAVALIAVAGIYAVTKD